MFMSNSTKNKYIILEENSYDLRKYLILAKFTNQLKTCEMKIFLISCHN